MTLADLAKEHCQKSAHKLAENELVELKATLDSDWQITGEKLDRKIEFPNFVQAFAFATAVALIAQGENHHPDLAIGWGYVNAQTTTHSAGGLSRNDFILAAKIDALPLT